METRFLFPHQFKKIGWIILIPSFILGLAILSESSNTWFPKFECKVFAICYNDFLSDTEYFSFIEHDIMDELISVFIIVGAIFVVCSKEKNEDEFIAKIRLESLIWAMYVNYAIVLFCIVFIYGMPFIEVMRYNMFTLPIIFLARFNFILYKTKKLADNEK